MSHHLVAAEGLRYRYPDGTPALAGVSFRIVHGESVALVGASGAGKSTLLLLLAGSLLPQEGRVLIGDFPVTPSTLPAVRRSVGLVFQDPDDQLFCPTVADDVAFGPRNLGVPEEAVAERVRTALAKVGAEALAKRPPHRLSAGEKRRAALATVLSMDPGVLVLDEPSSGLDPRGRRQLIAILTAFTHTKVVATHDLEMALETCARTIVLSKGTVRADGPTADLMRDDALLEEAGLERPASLRPCPSCGEGA